MVVARGWVSEEEEVMEKNDEWVLVMISKHGRFWCFIAL